MAHDVFISYSSKDKPIADAVCGTLEGKKVRCWIAPRDVLPGVPYGEAIVEAIEASKVMVLVFSSNSNSSPQVMREVERAVSKGIPIIPLRIEQVPPSKSLEFFISAPHWLDALTPPLEKHLQFLAETVHLFLVRHSRRSNSSEGESVADPRTTAERAGKPNRPLRPKKPIAPTAPEVKRPTPTVRVTPPALPKRPSALPQATAPSIPVNSEAKRTAHAKLSRTQKSIIGLVLLGLVVGPLLYLMLHKPTHKYDKLRDGMSINEVEEIMGGPGERIDLYAVYELIPGLTGGADSREKNGPSPIQTRRWEVDNKIVLITFVNGKMVPDGKQIEEK